MDTMRVLITGEVLANRATGVENYTRELIRALVARGDVDVTVLVPNGRVAASLPPGCERIVHRPLTGTSVPSYWAFPPRGLKRFDVIHCPTVRTPFLRKPTGVRLVMTVHDVVPLAAPSYHKPTYRIYFSRVLPHLLAQCDMLIADSQSTKNDLAEFLSVPTDHVQVVHAAGRWSVGDTKETIAPQPYFLAVGTLEPRKNLHRVLRAFGELRRRCPSIPDRLIIAGKPGWGDVRDDSLLRNRRDISWLGFVPDDQLKDLYQKAKALVYPSLYEGFGFPVLEAMSLGCPVITSHRSSLPEVAGHAAIYVDPEDTEQLVNAMERILTQQDLRASLVAKGYEQSRCFSWTRCAAETADVYRRVLESHVDRTANCPDPVWSRYSAEV
jgi:glycosyltransferase involved in cell wall biosynthesis